MQIKMFNGWYFFFIGLSVLSFLGLYFLLRKRKIKTQKIVLFSILVFALLLHFLKGLIPPYSLDINRWYRDSWFINICGANILLFVPFYLSKNERIKDYMFYIGLISGILSICLPLEPIQKVNQAGEWLDIIRFYIHHNILWQVPLLMILFKHHTLNYKRVIWVPIYFLGVLVFIILNQVIQSELGFVALRNDDFLNINYKNSSYIWGPGDEDAIANIFAAVCPSWFKTVPVGEYAGQVKYWPLIWLVFPMFIYVTPLCFIISMIFEHKHFKADFIIFKEKVKMFFRRKKNKEINSGTENISD